MQASIETLRTKQKLLAEKHEKVCRTLEIYKQKAEHTNIRRFKDVCMTGHETVPKTRSIVMPREENIKTADSSAEKSIPEQRVQSTPLEQGVYKDLNEQSNSRERMGSQGKINWADIVKNSINKTKYTKTAQERIIKTRAILDPNHMRIPIEPKSTTAHYRIVRRCPIGAIRHALWQSLPSCAFLGLSFVGGSSAWSAQWCLH